MTPAQALIVLVVAIVSGVLGAAVGQRKGSPVWGFFMGFFLSVIGLVIVAVSKPSAERQRPQGGGPVSAYREVLREGRDEAGS